MSLSESGWGLGGQAEQDEAGKPDCAGGDQGQLERLLRPGGGENITYKSVVCLSGGSNVQCKERSVELLEQAMGFTIDQMNDRVSKIEHLIEQAERQLGGDQWLAL